MRYWGLGLQHGDLEEVIVQPITFTTVSPKSNTVLGTKSISINSCMNKYLVSPIFNVHVMNLLLLYFFLVNFIDI